MSTPDIPQPVRDLLTAILEAVDVPHPATVGDRERFHQVLVDRALDAVTALRGVLQHGDDAGWSADYLRARLAEKPATGYRTWGEARTEPSQPPRAEETEAANRCARCRTPFDRADLRHDGRGRYASTPYCRSCIDNCRDGSAEHVCVICDPARYGGAR